MIFRYLLIFASLSFANPNDWATQVIDYQPGQIDIRYNHPEVALGPASQYTFNENVESDVPITIIEAAWFTNQIVSIGNGGHLILQFGQTITNDIDPYHLYGVDLLVYGNSFFNPINVAERFASPWINFSNEKAEIWLSQDLTNWFKAENRYADQLMPTQSIDVFGQPADYFKPINPALLTNDWFDGSWSYTNTVMAYEGAAGGSPIDLDLLVDHQDNPTNLHFANYIKFIDISGVSTEIDAVARVKSIPEPAVFLFSLMALLIAKRI